MKGKFMLSKKALNVLEQLFDEKSNLQLPAGVAEEVIEIRNWVKVELHIPDEEVKSFGKVEETGVKPV